MLGSPRLFRRAHWLVGRERKMRIGKFSLALTILLTAGIAQTPVVAAPSSVGGAPQITQTSAFDLSPPMRSLAGSAVASVSSTSAEPQEIPEPGTSAGNQPSRLDPALQRSKQAGTLNPLVNFEGLSNEDNLVQPRGRVSPPDPVGAVGPNHYVELVNLVWAVYDKQGKRLLGPLPLFVLWQNFAVDKCGNTSAGGDPVVLYDRRADRWILTQFTDPRIPPGFPHYNCIAVSQTGDPTGAYFRYAFVWGGPTWDCFPDYPKYSVWTDSYLLTSRDFGPCPGAIGPSNYGISVAALERQKMIDGDPTARMVRFFLDSNVMPTYLMGDGLLPADVDGWAQPRDGAPAPIIGSMNEGALYDAPFDALNIFELSVNWGDPSAASLVLAKQLPVASFTSTFPCTDTVTPNASQTRSCIPQPGTTRKIDVLSYRQRVTFRLAYRNFGGYEAMVTNQSVDAENDFAGVRWYEIRRVNGQYSVFQQGTYAPEDGVHRWMGSIAMDKVGNMGLGFSVSNATDVYPGIRFTARLRQDPPGQMTLGEGVIINGSGVQLSRFSRWGDYTTMSIDPTDDCTFWYVNEYIQNTAISLAPWQTRIASFRLPGCP